MQEKVLDDYPAIDYVVVGEGEETLRELLATPARNRRASKGWYLRDADGEAFFTGTGAKLLDLDNLPFPDYEKLAGYPGGLHPADLQLSEGPERQLHLQPRLPLRLQLLRPLGLPQELPLQLGRLSLPPSALSEGALSASATSISMTTSSPSTASGWPISAG